MLLSIRDVPLCMISKWQPEHLEWDLRASNTLLKFHLGEERTEAREMHQQSTRIGMAHIHSIAMGRKKGIQTQVLEVHKGIHKETYLEENQRKTGSAQHKSSILTAVKVAVIYESHTGSTEKSAHVNNATLVAFCTHCDLVSMTSKQSGKVAEEAV